MDNYIFETLERDSPILILGMSGGGDLTSAYLMKRKLESWKFDKVLYGTCQSILNADICDFYNSSTIYVPFFEELLEFIREDFMVVTFQSGLRHTFTQFEKILKREKIKYVLGVNGGGNLVCSGLEKEILSPALGSLSLALLNLLKVENRLCIIGPGIAGGITPKEFEQNLHSIKLMKGLVGSSWINEKDLKLLRVINTFRERNKFFSRSNKALQMALDGFRGKHTIGRTEVNLQEISTKIFWFKTSTVSKFNPFTSLVKRSKSIYEAYELINNWLADHRKSENDLHIKEESKRGD
ncbi:MAG: DUF1152 domain-containing protein [Promethearchaeia archaeon]